MKRLPAIIALAALMLMEDGKLKLDDMISRRVQLEDVNDAFAEMKRGEIARSVIVFN